MKAKIGTAAAALAVAAGVAWTLGPGLNGLSDDALAIALGIVAPPPVAAPPQTPTPPSAPPVTTQPALPGRIPPAGPSGGILPGNRPSAPGVTSVPAPGVPQPGPPSQPAPEQPIVPGPSVTPTPAPTRPSPVPPPVPAPTQPVTGCDSDTRLGSLICGIAGALS